MATQFLQSGLWAKITSLAKKAKRRYVAVAYLGSGATSLLPLGKRDILIADVSPTAVRAGQTNPYEVEKYLNRDVEVHSCSNLHAKVFVFDNCAIIGSSNVSKNSKDNLIETALLSTDPAIVTSARGFVLSLMGEHLTPTYVKYLQKEYKKDYTPRKGGKRRKKGEPSIHHPRLWVHRLVPVEFDEKENQLSESGTKRAREKLRDKRRYTVGVVSYDDRGRFTREAKFGDQIIQVWEEDDKLWVYPPSRIILIKPYVDSRPGKASKRLVFLEEPRFPKLLPWKRFSDALNKGGNQASQ